MMQNSYSDDDDDGRRFFAGVLRCVVVVEVTFDDRFLLVSRSSLFSAEIKTALFIGFRPRFDFLIGVARSALHQFRSTMQMRCF